MMVAPAGGLSPTASTLAPLMVTVRRPNTRAPSKTRALQMDVVMDSLVFTNKWTLLNGNYCMTIVWLGLSPFLYTPS